MYNKSKNKNRSKWKKILTSALCCTAMLFSTTAFTVSAELDFSESGQSQEQVVQEAPQQPQEQQPVVEGVQGGNQGDADAIAGLFSGGIDEESSAEAQRITGPWAKIIRVIISVILALLSVALFAITALDLVYIGIPLSRRWLGGGEQPQAGGMPGGMPGGMGGMGMSGGYGGGMGMSGGYGGGYGGGMGMSGGMGGGAPQGDSLGAKIGRIVSDEAIAAVQTAQMPNQNGQPGTKSTIIAYLKKRVVFLTVFGIASILLFTTVFTDLGLTIGNWIANMIGGLM